MKFIATLCITLFMVVTSVQVSGQTIQLGSGTNETTTTTSSPVNIWYRRFVCQFVYTAAEISAAGGVAGTPLNQIGFYVTQAPIYDLPGYTIQVKNTTATNVNNNLGTGGWTTVVNSFTYSPTAGGYDMIPFDTPFTWNGTSNIAVMICCSQVSPTYNQSGTCRYYSTTNGYKYTWTDAAGSSCGTNPATRTVYKPQCQMVFLEETTWTGAVDNVWSNAANWSVGVPNEFISALIPSGLSNYPDVSGTGASCKDITVEAGASLTLSGSNQLEVNGNWTMDGTFNCNTGTVEFAGSSTASLEGVSNQVFYNLTCSNSAGIILFGGSYDITGNLASEGGTITTNNRLRIVSNASGTGRIGEVKAYCDYTLNMLDSYGDGWNGGYLTVSQDGVSIGTFYASGSGSTATFSAMSGSSVVLNYTSGSWENENTFTLVDSYGSTLFSAGPNISTGDIYTTTSSCAISDPFVGNVQVQRYLSISNNEWRELTAPMTGQTLANWNDDGLIMTNFTGSNFPTFGWTSVYTYNENNANGVKANGWVATTNITNTLSPDNGHRVYIGTGNYTLDVTGDVHVGDYTFNLDYQNISVTEIAANEEEKGWNFIGNPYPGTIDWDQIDAGNKVNMEDAFWIWSGSAGNYGVYVGGAGSGTNGVGPEIASSQAFWVHAEGTGASLTTQESDKVNVDKAFVKSTTSEFISLKISSAINTYSDEVVVSFSPQFTADLDIYDGRKLLTSIIQAPSFYAMVNQEKMSICSEPLVEEVHIPLIAAVKTAGNYTVKTNQFRMLDTQRCLVLEDLSNGSIYLLDSSFSQNFQLVAYDSSARFMLHVYPSIQAIALDETCHGIGDGAIEIHAGGVPPYQFSVVSPTINALTQVTVQQFPEVLVGMNTGTYVLQTVPNNGCPTQNKTLVINGPNALQITPEIQDATCPVCDDGSISFTAVGGTAPYLMYLDGTLYDSEEVLMIGTYRLTIADAHDCVWEQEIIVNSDNSSVTVEERQSSIVLYPNPATDRLFISNNSNPNAKVLIYDKTGRLVITTSVFNNEIDIRNLAAGSYWLSLEGPVPVMISFVKIAN